MFYDPTYISRANIWLRKANNIKDTAEDQLYCKFFFLWTAFNALYNLRGSADQILEILEVEDIKSVLEKNKDNYLSLKNDFIINMESPSARNISHTFRANEIVRDINYTVEELKRIINKIRIIRNNLAHGSKEGIQRDRDLITVSVPILRDTVVVLLKKLTYRDD